MTLSGFVASITESSVSAVRVTRQFEGSATIYASSLSRHTNNCPPPPRGGRRSDDLDGGWFAGDQALPCRKREKRTEKEKRFFSLLLLLLVIIYFMCSLVISTFCDPQNAYGNEGILQTFFRGKCSVSDTS